MRNYIVAIIILILIGCKTREDKVLSVQSKWSSVNPLSINLKTRFKYWQKGNLIQNSSFEDGRVFYDSIDNSFQIKDWEIIGDNVYWQDSTNDSSLVFSGNKSVCITRKFANENDDTGEGIISNYIHVIPGKYNMNVAFRADSIYSVYKRWNNTLNDAINIRIEYYDKSKQKIKGELYLYDCRTKINSSEQWFGLHALKNGFSSGWNIYRCKYTNNLILNGIIPDKTRWVRLFLGLKGTGTIWYDDIYFAMDADNFTLNEKYNLLYNKNNKQDTISMNSFFKQNDDNHELCEINNPLITDTVLNIYSTDSIFYAISTHPLYSEYPGLLCLNDIFAFYSKSKCIGEMHHCSFPIMFNINLIDTISSSENNHYLDFDTLKDITTMERLFGVKRTSILIKLSDFVTRYYQTLLLLQYGERKAYLNNRLSFYKDNILNCFSELRTTNDSIISTTYLNKLEHNILRDYATINKKY
jgi:hypothetical protein